MCYHLLVTTVTTILHSLSLAPGDYTAITSMELTFSATVQSQTVMITIADGDVVEGPETFSVTLTTSDTAVVLNPMTATVDIQDDDGKLSVQQDRKHGIDEIASLLS